MCSRHTLRSLILFFLCAIVEAFSVTVGAATQCAPFNISWTGGKGPYEVIVFPTFSVPVFYSVPSTAYNGNKGSYSIPQLPLPQGAQFVLIMSDATGFAAGGTSNLITVAGSTSSNCNTSPQSLAYTFSMTPNTPQQCASNLFYGYDSAALPVAIWGIIPGGESFVIQAGVSAANYSWTTDVSAGTSLIFSMIDANNRTGGSSALEIVGASGDSSCLNSNSPSSTASGPQASASASASSSPTSSKVSTATIIGVVAGGVVALAALVFLGLFIARKRRKNRPTYTLDPPRNAPLLYPDEFHPEPTRRQTMPYRDHAQSSVPLNATLLSTSSQGTYSPLPTSTPSPGSSMLASSGRGKGSMTVLTPTRFIVHTDADDTGSEVIELPPQYSERRVPGLQPEPLRPMSSVSEFASTDVAYASDAFQDQPSHSYSGRRPPL